MVTRSGRVFAPKRRHSRTDPGCNSRGKLIKKPECWWKGVAAEGVRSRADHRRQHLSRRLQAGPPRRALHIVMARLSSPGPDRGRGSLAATLQPKLQALVGALELALDALPVPTEHALYPPFTWSACNGLPSPIQRGPPGHVEKHVARHSGDFMLSCRNSPTQVNNAPQTFCWHKAKCSMPFPVRRCNHRFAISTSIAQQLAQLAPALGVAKIQTNAILVAHQATGLPYCLCSPQ